MKYKSFTLMEILLGAMIFVGVTILATAVISSVVNARNKVVQQKNVNTAAQKIFEEIGKDIRDGDPAKQIYICSNDATGQLVDSGWWGASTHNPPNNYTTDGTITNNQLFGEQIGARRVGNILQIVELNSNTAGTDIGWYRLNNNPPPIQQRNIQSITQYSVEFVDDSGTQGSQLVKLVMDNINYETGAWWLPCRNLTRYLEHPNWLQDVNIHELLPNNVRLSNTENLNVVNTPNINYFFVEGCDDLKSDTDGPNAPNDLGAIPDNNGIPLTCFDNDTTTRQSMYSPIVRISLGLESGAQNLDNQTGRFIRSIFQTSFQTRRIFN